MTPKTADINLVQLRTSYTPVVGAYFSYKLHDHLFCQALFRRCVLVLVISLPALAKQPTEKAHGLALDLLCGKLLYCLAPDFFLIGMLKVFSARSIITSLA